MSGSDFDPYEVLGAVHEATPEGLKRLYRELAKSHHPNAGGDREKWDQLSEAYQILIDPDRRAFFDQTGRIDQVNHAVDHQQACAIIAETITTFADQFVLAKFNPDRDPRRLPVMELVAECLQEEMAKAEEALQTGRAHLNFWRDFAKRVTRREEATGLDQVEAVIKQKISGIEKTIVQVEEAVRVRKVAIKVLADYRFERDAPAFEDGTRFSGVTLGEFMR